MVSPRATKERERERVGEKETERAQQQEEGEDQRKMSVLALLLDDTVELAADGVSQGDVRGEEEETEGADQQRLLVDDEDLVGNGSRQT